MLWKCQKFQEHNQSYVGIPLATGIERGAAIYTTGNSTITVILTKCSCVFVSYSVGVNWKYIFPLQTGIKKFYCTAIFTTNKKLITELMTNEAVLFVNSVIGVIFLKNFLHWQNYTCFTVINTVSLSIIQPRLYFASCKCAIYQIDI